MNVKKTIVCNIKLPKAFRNCELNVSDISQNVRIFEPKCKKFRIAFGVFDITKKLKLNS